MLHSWFGHHQTNKWIQRKINENIHTSEINWSELKGTKSTTRFTDVTLSSEDAKQMHDYGGRDDNIRDQSLFWENTKTEKRLGIK